MLHFDRSTDLHASTYQAKNDVHEKIINVSYGVEHGREIEFPLKPRSQGTISLVSETSVGQGEELKSKSSRGNEPYPKSLLQEHSRPVVNVERYDPGNIQQTTGYGRKKRKPIMSYATAREPAPKFVPEKFIHDESVPPHRNKEQHSDGFILFNRTTIGAMLGLSAAVTLSVVTILGSREGRRQVMLTQGKTTATV